MYRDVIKMKKIKNVCSIGSSYANVFICISYFLCFKRASREER